MRQRLFLQINLTSSNVHHFMGEKGRLSIKTGWGGKLARSFNFMFRYIDDVFSMDNTKFEDFVDGIYPIELEKKDTGMLHTLTYTSELTVMAGLERNITTRDDSNFFTVNFPFICSNIPAAPAYGVHIS